MIKLTKTNSRNEIATEYAASLVSQVGKVEAGERIRQQIANAAIQTSGMESVELLSALCAALSYVVAIES